MNKREKTTIISKIVINIGLIALFIVLFKFFINPSNAEIKVQKDELIEIYNKYKKLTKNGIDFPDFKSNSEVTKNKNLVNILPNITPEFYKTNYYNSTKDDFETFLQKKEDEVAKVKKTNIAELREQLLSSVLPKYSEAYSVEGTSSDLEFVNYLETMFNRFNVVTTASLGVKELVPLGGNASKTDKKLNSNVKNFEGDIFYIPMDLDLKGTKEDLLKFIYYISNINIINGDVNTKNDLHTIFYKDDFIQRDLNGISYVKEENNMRSIPNKFITRMVDIQSIEIPEYFDKSINTRDLKQNSVVDYVNFLIDDRKDSNTEYDIKLSVNFYTRGVSQTVIVNDIKKIQTAFNTLKTTISGDLKKLQSDTKNAGKNVEKITKLSSLDKYLAQLDLTAKALVVNGSTENINQKYIQAKDLEYDINRISTIYKEIKK